MTNLINKIGRKMIIPGLIAKLILIPVGCREASKDFCKTSTYNGYEVSISEDGLGRKIRINAEHKGRMKEKAQIIGKNIVPEIYLGLFNTISVDNEIPLEDDVRKYANFDSLNKIYSIVYENGIDCEEYKISKTKK